VAEEQAPKEQMIDFYTEADCDDLILGVNDSLTGWLTREHQAALQVKACVAELMRLSRIKAKFEKKAEK